MKISRATQQRLNAQATFYSRLWAYGKACALGPNKLVEESLKGCKDAMQDLIEAARQEGRAQLLQEVVPNYFKRSCPTITRDSS